MTIERDSPEYGYSLEYYGQWPVIPNPLPPVPEGPVLDGLAVLILCAGDIHAWEGDEPRQLRLLGGQKILTRTIRQIRASGHEPTIITHRDDIREATLDCEHFEPKERRTIAETWLYTRELWRAQTAVLLGDVYFGPITIRETLEYQGPMRMVGNHSEIYAHTFSKEVHDRVAKVLHLVNQEVQKGASWQIYSRWCGMPYGLGDLETEVFHWVSDRTCDIDVPRHYAGAKKLWG